MRKLLQRSSFPVATKSRNYRCKGAQPLFLLVIVTTVESDTRSGRARRGFERALRGMGEVRGPGLLCLGLNHRPLPPFTPAPLGGNTQAAAQSTVALIDFCCTLFVSNRFFEVGFSSQHDTKPVYSYSTQKGSWNVRAGSDSRERSSDLHLRGICTTECGLQLAVCSWRCTHSGLAYAHSSVACPYQPGQSY